MPVSFEGIRELRLRRKLTVAEAARRAGWAAPKWSNLEAGRRTDPRISTLEAVAKVLKCKVDDLLRRRRGQGS